MTNDEQHYRTGITRARRMAIVVGSAAVLAGIIGTQYQDRGMTMEQAPPSTRIEYTVTGSSPAVTVTYLNDLSFTDTKTGTPPWKYGFRAVRGRALSLVVQNNADGTIGCAIRGDGRDLATVSESTESTITCAAVVPE